MDEISEQERTGSEGVTTPPVAVPMPEAAAAPEPAPVPTPGPVPVPPPLAAPAPVPEPVPSPAPMMVEEGNSDDAFAVFPGGDAPSSSGFSWRVPGSLPTVMHSQGGIPNEFDHLFRDSDADGRRSLMPSQGPIGVSMPTLQPAAYSAPKKTPQGDPALPAYQTPAQQGQQQQQQGQQQAGYPRQPYQDTYQQAGYQQQTTHVPVGPPGGDDDDDQRNTQAIPRVPVQPYAYPAQGAPAPANDRTELVGPRRSSTTPMLAAVGVFVVLVVVASVVMFNGGSDKKTGTGTTVGGQASGTPANTAAAAKAEAVKAQADALYVLVLQSKAARSAATTAVDNVNVCKDVATGQTTFASAATTRTNQATQIGQLPVDLLPAGTAQLVADLKAAWATSATSETEYKNWANDNLTCTGKPGSKDNLVKGNNDGVKAGGLKITAAKEWNTLLVPLGEPSITDDAL